MPGLLARVRELCLRGVYPWDLRAAAVNRPPQLTTLEVVFARLGDDAAADLVRQPLGGGLRRLTLNRCDVGDDAARAIAAAPALEGLTNLDLTDNRLSDDGAAALADASCLASLTHLRLGGNWIGGGGALALAAATFTGLPAGGEPPAR